MEEREQYGHADQSRHRSYESDKFRKQHEGRPALRMVLSESVV